MADRCLPPGAVRKEIGRDTPCGALRGRTSPPEILCHKLRRQRIKLRCRRASRVRGAGTRRPQWVDEARGVTVVSADPPQGHRLPWRRCRPNLVRCWPTSARRRPTWESLEPNIARSQRSPAGEPRATSPDRPPVEPPLSRPPATMESLQARPDTVPGQPANNNMLRVCV